MKKQYILWRTALLTSLLLLSACSAGQVKNDNEISNMEESETETVQTAPSGLPRIQPGSQGLDESQTPEESQTLEAAQETISPESGLTEQSGNGMDQPTEPVVRTIDQIDLNAFFADTDTEATPFELSLVSESENQVSEPDNWFRENRLYLPMINGPLSESARQIFENPALDYEYWNQYTRNPVFFDDNYIYEWSPEEIRIYDFDSAELFYQVQITSDDWYLMGNCACVRNGILYTGSIFNGYAMPDSCYMLAYDLVNDKLLWRSEDQTYNSMNFIVKDDVIFCGYGFTAEPDYIYQISMRTGKVISRTQVSKMPDLFAEKDGQLYVHTYSYDCVFRIEKTE